MHTYDVDFILHMDGFVEGNIEIDAESADEARKIVEDMDHSILLRHADNPEVTDVRVGTPFLNE